MNYTQYEKYDFDKASSFNMSFGSQKTSHDMHWHSYGEIILVGPGTPQIYNVNQKQYELARGDIVLIWPMEMHAIIDADLSRTTNIHFANAFFNSLFDLQRIMHYFRNLDVIRKETHPEVASLFEKTIARMSEIFLSEDVNRELKCSMLVMQLALILDQHHEEFYDELDTEAKRTSNMDVMSRMITVTDYIKNNLTADDLSQGAMAEMAGVSREYFSRIFKNVTGKNYNKWLNMIRLEKATELLAMNSRTLTEVAMLSGFKSMPSFNRVFRNEKGMSPGEYRALFLEGRNHEI